MGKNKNGLKKYDNVGYFFVLPFVIVFCIFSVYPVVSYRITCNNGNQRTLINP